MPERKVAVVTGSATGVGAATVLGLARRGYDVVINYTKSEVEAAASAAACAEAGADTLVVRADVADDAACRSMVSAAVEPLTPTGRKLTGRTALPPMRFLMMPS